MVNSFSVNFRLDNSTAQRRLSQTFGRFRRLKTAMEDPNGIDLRVNTDRANERLNRLGQEGGRAIGSLTNPLGNLNGTFTRFRTNVLGASESLSQIRRRAGTAAPVLVDTATSADVLSNAMTRLESRMRAFLVVFAIGAIGGGVVSFISRTVDEVTDLENRLRLVTDNAGDLRDTLADVFDIARDTRSAFDSTGQLFSRTALALQGQRENEEIARFVRGFNQSTILSGTSATEARGGALQFSQALQSGRFGGDEARSVRENLPDVYRGIIRETERLGITLRDLAEGNVDVTNVLFDSVINRVDELEERFQTTTPTISQSAEVFKTAFTEAFSVIDDNIPITETFSRVLLTLADNMGLVIGAGTVLVGSVLVALGGPLITIATTGITRLSASFVSATASVRGFTAALLSNPFTLALTGVGLVAGAIISLRRDVQDAHDTHIRFYDELEDNNPWRNAENNANALSKAIFQLDENTKNATQSWREYQEQQNRDGLIGLLTAASSGQGALGAFLGLEDGEPVVGGGLGADRGRRLYNRILTILAGLDDDSDFRGPPDTRADPFSVIPEAVDGRTRRRISDLQARYRDSFDLEGLTERANILRRQQEVGTPQQRAVASQELGIINARLNDPRFISRQNIINNQPGRLFDAFQGDFDLAERQRELQEQISANRPGGRYTDVFGSANERILREQRLERERQALQDSRFERFQEQTDGIFDTLENALAQFVLTGEISFRELGESLVSEFVESAASNIGRILQEQLFNAITGGNISGVGTGAAGFLASFLPAQDGLNARIGGNSFTGDNLILPLRVNSGEDVIVRNQQQQSQGMGSGPINIINNINPGFVGAYMRGPRGRNITVNTFQQNSRGLIGR